MASEFIWRDPEAAKQAIAQMQVAAAAAENQSRERIAREQTAAQRYATQAQIADRDKDRAVAREDIASRSRYGTAAVNQERGNIQYNTILASITAFDPPTKREMEAALANSLLSDDLKNDLRAARERAYKVAKHNFETGDQAARNYKTELAGKKPGDIGLDKIYERIAGDKNVIFDRATGAVESAHRPPREDTATQSNILGATRPGGVFPSAQEMQALGSATPAPRVTTLDEIRAQLGSRETRPLIGALPPTQATITAQPSPGFTPRNTDFAVPPQSTSEGYPEYSHVNQPGIGVLRFATPTTGDMVRIGGAETPPFIDMSDSGRRTPTVSELYGPPNNLSFQSTDIPPRPVAFALPPAPPQASLFPARPPQISPMDRLLQSLPQIPEFARLPAEGQQRVLDLITGGALSMPAMTTPRVSDFGTIRPEFVPQDPGYYVAPQ